MILPKAVLIELMLLSEYFETVVNALEIRDDSNLHVVTIYLEKFNRCEGVFKIKQRVKDVNSTAILKRVPIK